MTGRDLCRHLEERGLLDRRLFVMTSGRYADSDPKRGEVIVATVALDPPTPPDPLTAADREALRSVVISQQTVVLLEGA